MITKDSKEILVGGEGEFYERRLNSILAEAGHKLRHAHGRETIIEILKKDPEGTDLLILDMETPGVDGYGLLQWLKENGLIDRLHILAATDAGITTGTIDRLKKLGVSGLISKSFTPEHIVYSVNRLIFKEKIDHRVAPRVPVSIPADFTAGGNRCTGSLLNISSTGTFLHSGEKLLIGARLNLLFALPGINRGLGLKGVVMWSTKQSAGKARFGGAGIMFTSLSEEDKEALNGFIASELKRLGPEAED